MEAQDITTAILKLSASYQELNNDWENDPCLINTFQTLRQDRYHDFHQKNNTSNFENLILNIVSNSIDKTILNHLHFLIENNINIYQRKKNEFDNLDFNALYCLDERNRFEDRLAVLLKDKEDILDYPYPSEQERKMLLREIQRERNLLENERSEYIRTNTWMLRNYYSLIYDISQSFIQIINSYFPVQQETVESPTPDIEPEENPITEQLDENNKPPITVKPIIEPDMIFRSDEMYNKFQKWGVANISDKTSAKRLIMPTIFIRTGYNVFIMDSDL